MLANYCDGCIKKEPGYVLLRNRRFGGIHYTSPPVGQQGQAVQKACDMPKLNAIVATIGALLRALRRVHFRSG